MVANKRTKYLIIGNSAGGVCAAEAIREMDKVGSLTMLSDEPYPAYSRPLISEYLAQPYPVERMLYRTPDFYEKNKIRTIFGDKVVQVDTDEHTVKLESGKTLIWQKLLLATGGTPIFPKLEGTDLKGVFTFNKLDDAKAIDKFLNQHRSKARAVVIGGGLIGVSVTEALIRRGANVIIVEMKDRILNTILDEETSALETEVLKQTGITIITDHTVEKINSYLPGEVSGVTLDDGRLFPCELVIIAIGVQPRLDCIAESGIRINRGIIVDRTMATSAPDIYACGDVAEAHDFVHGENRLTPIWPNACTGGRVAGLNMAGTEAEYQGGTAMNAMKYFGVNIVSAGILTPPDDSYEIISHEYNGTYKKVIIKDGKVTGLVFAGDIEKSGIVYNLMKDGVDVSNFKKVMVAEDFGLAYLPEEIRQAHLEIPPEVSDSLVTAVEEPEELPIGD